MGRQAKKLDIEKLLEMADNETPVKEMSQVLGVSAPTIRDRISKIQSEQGIILESKAVENLRVIKLKEEVITRLENNLYKMEAEDLIRTLNVLNKMDAPEKDLGRVKGLLGLLTAIDDEAERRSEEKLEKKEIENNTIEVKKFPNL